MANDGQFSEKKMVAMLIDGDNAQPSLIREILAEVSKYGRTTVRRIYGDWTTPNMNGWKETLQDNAIQPVQQFRHTIGKNATDSAMIIDAMDILHSGVVDGFCVVSSDSDYTRLATRIRERGVFVMGIGQKKTPKAFTNACDVFVFTENLVPAKKQTAAEAKKVTTAPAVAPATDALPLLKKAFELCVQDDGWAYLSSMGSHLRSLDPTFDHRTFGCSSLRALVAKLSETIEMREEKTTAGNIIVFIRLR
jgi:uncharacterized LabA/DUF88 family protein